MSSRNVPENRRKMKKKLLKKNRKTLTEKYALKQGGNLTSAGGRTRWDEGREK